MLATTDIWRSFLLPRQDDERSNSQTDMATLSDELRTIAFPALMQRYDLIGSVTRPAGLHSDRNRRPHIRELVDAALVHAMAREIASGT
jgi:hypothetical protein